MIGIVNGGNEVLTNPLAVSDLQNLDRNARELQILYNRVRSDIISKAIEG